MTKSWRDRRIRGLYAQEMGADKDVRQSLHTRTYHLCCGEEKAVGHHRLCRNWRATEPVQVSFMDEAER